MAAAYSNGARMGEVGGQIGHFGGVVAECALDVDAEQAAQATEPRASASVSARAAPFAAGRGTRVSSVARAITAPVYESAIVIAA